MEKNVKFPSSSGLVKDMSPGGSQMSEPDAAKEPCEAVSVVASVAAAVATLFLQTELR